MDLPRFHSGRIGPLTFEHLNEVMSRLDALLPLLDSVAIDKTQQFPRLERVMIVHAFPSSGGPDIGGKYDWREIIIRGDEEGLEEPADSIANETDNDWEDIDATSQYRSGQAYIEAEKEGDEPTESDTYAISVDPSFESGISICLAYRRTDGSKRYVLVPPRSDDGTGTTNRMHVARIVDHGGSGPVPVKNAQGTTLYNLQAFRYSAKKMMFEGGAASLEAREGDDIIVFDFGLTTPNAPTHNTGATLGPVESLDIGTIVTVLDQGGWYSLTGLLPLQVNCQ